MLEMCSDLVSVERLDNALFSLIAVTSTSAVEFGQDATGDPTAVKVRGCLLYTSDAADE